MDRGGCDDGRFLVVLLVLAQALETEGGVGCVVLPATVDFNAVEGHSASADDCWG